MTPTAKSPSEENPHHRAGRILFVDDEESMREWIAIALEKAGHEVDVAPDGASALALFDACPYDMVLHDLKMPGMHGLELLSELLSRDPTLPVVVLTAFSTWDNAVEAMRLGAYDYLKKPIDNNDDLRSLVQRALDRRSLAATSSEEDSLQNMTRIIGSSPEILEILSLVHRIAPTDSTVVIHGESGTGKELVARMIHNQSHRRTAPFLGINCGAVNEALLESEIYGHRRGAFTGAVADKQGLLAMAEGGTFFLDEVGEMSLSTQVSLLRVLETRTYMPVGSTTQERADIRLVAATNRDLAQMVGNRSFREDLFYRLNVIPIEIPPLRDRKDDIPLLAGHFLSLYATAFRRNIEGFTDSALEALMSWDWPGNVRELQNTIQRAVTLTTSHQITKDVIIPPRTTAAGASPSSAEASPVPENETSALAPTALTSTVPSSIPPGFDLEAHMQDVESACIKAALAATDGNLTNAAERLGISFRSIRYKVKKLGLKS